MPLLISQVTYSILGFLDKNRDTLRAEWMTALMSSKNRFVAVLFTQEEIKEDEKAEPAFKTLSRGGGGRKAGSKIPTIGAQFNVNFKMLLIYLSIASFNFYLFHFSLSLCFDY